MNFTEAVSEVLSIVKRPDKILDARREVNAAVNFFSSDQDFKRDVNELQLAIVATEYSQNILLSSLPLFRKIQYIKRGNTKEYLTELEAKKIVTDLSSQDKWYLAGSGIRINMCKLAATLDIGYFQFPPTLTDIAPTFWMLDTSPYMVINRAAGIIFRNIGDDASSKGHLNTSNETYLAFRSDNGI